MDTVTSARTTPNSEESQRATVRSNVTARPNALECISLVSYALTLCDLQSLQLVFCRLSLLLITSQDGGEAGHHCGLQRSMLRAHYLHSTPPICKGYISVAQIYGTASTRVNLIRMRRRGSLFLWNGTEH